VLAEDWSLLIGHMSHVWQLHALRGKLVLQAHLLALEWVLINLSAVFVDGQGKSDFLFGRLLRIFFEYVTIFDELAFILLMMLSRTSFYYLGSKKISIFLLFNDELALC
jgi:hypothetical protein